MDLNTGFMLDALAGSFPVDGHVFWWDLPEGKFEPGSLVVGRITLSNHPRGTDDKDWYQLADGHIPKGEVFELIQMPLGPDQQLRSLIDGRRSVMLHQIPQSQFYSWSGGGMNGPFVAEVYGENGNGFTFAVVDAVRGFVTRFAGDSLSDYVNNDGGHCEAKVSLNNRKYGHPESDRREFTYRLIRQLDLESLSSEREQIVLLSDEQVISKACKSIFGRAKKKQARDTLIELLKQLKENEEAQRSGVFEGLQEIYQRSQHLDSVITNIADTLLEQPQVQERIAQREVEEIADTTGFYVCWKKPGLMK